MSVFLLPNGYWAADVHLNLGELQTHFRIESASSSRAMIMAMAMAHAKALVAAL